MRDRTQRRKLEEELRASKAALVEKIRIIDELYEHILQSGKCKAIQEHTAEVAHELRQPLAIIGGFARRMDRQLSSDEPDISRHRQYSDVIVSEISRLEKILDRLVDFTARDEVRLENVNPNELIEYIIHITEGRAREKRIKIEANLGRETGDIPLDPGRFQQLVLNLVCNAIEASPLDSVIRVETGVSLPSDKALASGNLEAEGYFEMKIHNDGPKIPEEALQKVFNPFFTTKEHGTGLGLTVTKKIVEDHTGSISVRSGEGGTTFTVWLPLTSAANGQSGFCLVDSGNV
jgi:signal transduction histidine kinase